MVGGGSYDNTAACPSTLTCELHLRVESAATFKEYLKEEGVTPPDEMIQLDFETRPNLPKSTLKTLALKDGYKDNQIKGFKRTHFPWLYEEPAEFKGKINDVHIDLDLYPKIEAMSTQDKANAVAEASIRNKGKIASETMHCLILTGFTWRCRNSSNCAVGATCGLSVRV